MFTRKNKYAIIAIAASWLIIIAAQRQILGGPHHVSTQQLQARPTLDHILVEVSDMGKSLVFYRDCLGLTLTSQSHDFAVLTSSNAGISLWQNHWGWEIAHASQKCRGLGIYPHFEVNDPAAMVERFRKAGFVIVQEPRIYDWGTEAFVRDPDGYTIALLKLTRKQN